MKEAKKMKLLIFKVGALGDTIMTTPLLRQLRKNYPDCRIDYLIGKAASKVLEGNPNADEVISFDENIIFKKNIFGILKLAGQMRKRKYDCVLVLDKHWIFGFLAMLFGIKQRIGFDRMGKEGKFLSGRVFFDGTEHEIIYYLRIGRKLGAAINFNDTGTEIFPGQQDRDFATSMFSRNKLRNAIAIAPGGANNPGQKAFSKLWPRDNFVELVKNIPAKHSLLLLGDHNDSETCNYIASRSGRKILDLSGKTSIMQTCALMKRCALVICNDTGSLHMASASNEKIISIFGPTDPRRFAPIGRKRIYHWSREKCAPCNSIYGHFQPCHGRACMHAIAADDILKSVKKLAKK